MSQESNKIVEILGITTNKSTNFSEWYREIISKGKLIEYTDISGCYVFMPASYEIWEQIQKYMDTHLKQMDVRNVYFPIFITETNLNIEKDHIAGFSPDVAWVTPISSAYWHCTKSIAFGVTLKHIIALAIICYQR